MMLLYFLFLSISIIVCAYAAYLLVKRTGLFCILFFSVFSGFIQKGLSATYLDMSNYAVELYITTWNVYAGPSYFFITALLFLLIYAFVGRTHTVSNGQPSVASVSGERNLLQLGLPIIGLCVTAYLFLDMLISGIPLFSGGAITRFNYWSSFSRLPFSDTISNLATLVCLGLGVLYASSSLSGKRGSRLLFVVALLLCVRFMLGYKVSGIIDVVLAFGTGYICRRYTSSETPSNNIWKAMKLILGVGIAAIVSYMAFQVASGTVATFGDAWDSLLEREFSMSGHLWWAVFGDTRRSFSLFPTDLSELLSVFQMKSELDTDIGVYGVMREYAPSAVFADYVQNGVRMGGCSVTVSLFYNGIFVTLLILVLNAFILSRFFASFMKDAASNRILSMMVLWRIFQIYLSYLTAHGTLVGFYCPSVLLMLVIYAFVRMYENQVNLKYDRLIGQSPHRSASNRPYAFDAKGSRLA